MRQKSEWLIRLWKREWEQCRKDWLKLVCIEVSAVVFACVCFVLWGVQMDRFVEYTLKMPPALYAFWGVTAGVVTGKASFYVRWLLMPLQVWIAWKTCDGMIRSIWVEEESGTIFYLCNQWYSRQQIILAKYLWNVVKFIAGYFALFVVCVLLACGGWGFGRLCGMFAKGLLVMGMMLSLSSCYAVLSRRKEEVLWTDILIFGTLIAGNLYKVRDLFVLLLQRADRSDKVLRNLIGWLDGLKWISPLSWLNPFVKSGVRGTVIQVVICIVVTGLSVVITLFGYRVRNFSDTDV